MTDQGSPELSRLTPAAREALDELVDDYRRALVLRATTLAGRAGTSSEVTVSDVVHAQEDFDTPRSARMQPERQLRLSRVLRLYVALGIYTTVIFAGLLIFQLTRDASSTERLALIGGFSGILITVFGASAQVLILRHPSREDLRSDPGDLRNLFLDRWIRLELELRETGALLFGESSLQELRLTEILSLLTKQGAIDDKDNVAIRQALSTRNAIVHGQPWSSTDAAARLEALETPLKKLSAARFAAQSDS